MASERDAAQFAVRLPGSLANADRVLNGQHTEEAWSPVDNGLGRSRRHVGHVAGAKNPFCGETRSNK